MNELVRFSTNKNEQSQSMCQKASRSRAVVDRWSNILRSLIAGSRNLWYSRVQGLLQCIKLYNCRNCEMYVFSFLCRFISGFMNFYSHHLEARKSPISNNTSITNNRPCYRRNEQHSIGHRLAARGRCRCRRCDRGRRGTCNRRRASTIGGFVYRCGDAGSAFIRYMDQFNRILRYLCNYMRLKPNVDSHIRLY